MANGLKTTFLIKLEISPMATDIAESQGVSLDITMTSSGYGFREQSGV